MKIGVFTGLLAVFLGLMALAGPGVWLALYVIGLAAVGRLP